MVSFRRFALPALVLVAGACGDPDPEATFVARAADHQLTVEEEARLLARVDTLETPRRAALAVANLWVDYTLLGRAVNEDTTFAQLQLEPIVEAELERAMLSSLADSVRRADAVVTEAEIGRRYAAEAGDSELRVRQIRIDVPPGAPAARHDSAVQALEELRRRIVEGGDSFEELAREHSQDPQSGPLGGDLGYFGPGDMVPGFDSAAQGLEIGEVGGPVQTRYGYHLIRLEDRRTPTREAFGERLRRQRAASAVSEYASDRLEQAAPDVRDNAPALARRLAQDPDARLPEGLSDTLVDFQGGAVTVADLLDYYRRQPQARREVAAAPREQVVDRLLLPLARTQILAAQARRQGLGPGADETAGAGAAFRRQLLQTSRDLGLLAVPGDQDFDLERVVDDLLLEIVRDERPVVPLGPVSQALRAHYPSEIRDDRTLLVVRRLDELRGGGGGGGGQGGTADEDAAGEG